MKSLMIFLVYLLISISTVSAVIAGSCYSDPIVKRWIEEIDHAAENVVQQWAQGSSPEKFVSDVAVIISNEFYVFSQCREEPKFLETHILFLNKGSDPRVETVPAMILEHLFGYDILSPWSQFPSGKREVKVKHD